MKVAQAAPAEERGSAPYKLVPAARPITFKHVLTHTAGFTNSYRGIAAGVRKGLSSKEHERDCRGCCKTAGCNAAEFQPGDAWEYGPATDVVGRLVEVIAGGPRRVSPEKNLRASQDD